MFKVGITKDFLTSDGKLVYKDMGLDILDNAPGIEYEFIKTHQSPVTPAMLHGYDAVLSLAPAYNKTSFEGVRTLKAICRFGVGYDMVDLDACNDAGIIVTITRGAVNYSVAESVIAWMLALSHRVLQKDALVRKGKWADRTLYMGSELRNKTLGIIGLGGIGGKLVQMLENFGMNTPIAYDPYANKEVATKYNVQLVELNTLLSESDFISVNCPLTNETRNLVGAKELSLMKKDAYIINTARGGIINEKDLLEVLKAKSIAGYATDVFETEPATSDNALFELDNVILAPHSIAWTDELFSEIGRMACRQLVQIAEGKKPDHVVNTQILDQWYSK